MPILEMSQSEALCTVLISSCDIKSLTWHPTASWTACKVVTLLLSFDAKINKELLSEKPQDVLNVSSDAHRKAN